MEQTEHPIMMRSNVVVELIDASGSDNYVYAAAKVLNPDELRATLSQNHKLTGRVSGLIKYLMKNRHGSPFEHGYIQVYVDAPIFVWREIMRHRINSYNEESGRWGELRPDFWVPYEGRPILKTEEHKSTEPDMRPADPMYELVVHSEYRNVCQQAWESYQGFLKDGVAPEVARGVLPVGTYSRGWVRFNPRSAMHFISLRTKREDAAFLSHPQREIEMVAEKLEEILKQRWPLTYKWFNEFGRVAP